MNRENDKENRINLNYVFFDKRYIYLENEIFSLFNHKSLANILHFHVILLYNQKAFRKVSVMYI